MHYLLSLSAALLSLMGAVQASPAYPVPRANLYCCPEVGPNGLSLYVQQNGPFAIFCYYDETTEQGCFYDPGSGSGGGPAAGCPTQAPSNPDYPSLCPGVNT